MCFTDLPCSLSFSSTEGKLQHGWDICGVFVVIHCLSPALNQCLAHRRLLTNTRCINKHIWTIDEAKVYLSKSTLLFDVPLFIAFIDFPSLIWNGVGEAGRTRGQRGSGRRSEGMGSTGCLQRHGMHRAQNNRERTIGCCRPAHTKIKSRWSACQVNFLLRGDVLSLPH